MAGSTIALAAAKAFGQVVVLKGERTVVTDGDRVYVNDTGNSALSKAGTGDVLSGHHRFADRPEDGPL